MIRIIAKLSAFIFIIYSCKSVKLAEIDYEYRKELTIESSGVVIKGFGNLDKRDKYELVFKSEVDADLIRINNCHRDEIFRSVEDNEFKYTYTPNSSIENGSCIIHIAFLEKEGFNEFGALTFTDDETLKANVSCSGSKYEAIGSSTCQARENTIQSIEFEAEVENNNPDDCEIKKESGKLYSYYMKSGYCIFLFKDLEGNYHKHTSYGYNEVYRK